MARKYTKPKAPKRITDAYLNEKVNYGGEMITRGAMIKDLQNLARSQYPKNKQKQAALVDAYLRGHR